MSASVPPLDPHDWENITDTSAPMGLVVNQWRCRNPKCGAIRTDWTNRLDVPKGTMLCGAVRASAVSPQPPEVTHEAQTESAEDEADRRRMASLVRDVPQVGAAERLVAERAAVAPPTSPQSPLTARDIEILLDVLDKHQMTDAFIARVRAAVVIGSQWMPQTCDKCKTVVPIAFMAIEVKDGGPIDDPAGFNWCIVCHAQRVIAELRATPPTWAPDLEKSPGSDVIDRLSREASAKGEMFTA